MTLTPLQGGLAPLGAGGLSRRFAAPAGRAGGRPREGGRASLAVSGAGRGTEREGDETWRRPGFLQGERGARRASFPEHGRRAGFPVRGWQWCRNLRICVKGECVLRPNHAQEHFLIPLCPPPKKIPFIATHDSFRGIWDLEESLEIIWLSHFLEISFTTLTTDGRLEQCCFCYDLFSLIIRFYGALLS